MVAHTKHQALHPALKILSSALLMVAGVSCWGGLYPSSVKAQSDNDVIQPRCERRSGDNWICVYIKDAKDESGSKPYKSYEGQVRNGEPNGRGVIVYENDDRYEGQVKNGIPNGKGMFLFADNSRYEGDMRNGKPNGSGTFTFTTGDRYTGSVKAGEPHGRGVFTFANGDIYEGEFYLGQAKGQGVFISKGMRCQGVFFSSQLSGQGACTYPPGSSIKSYTGEFRGGKAEGRGTMVTSDGKRFSGEFRGGRPFVPSLEAK